MSVIKVTLKLLALAHAEHGLAAVGLVFLSARLFSCPDCDYNSNDYKGLRRRLEIVLLAFWRIWPMELRVGLGADIHRLAPGGPLLLGGVQIECDLRLIGHSDADVLLHAITDAVLGAVCLGDIGQLFPDTDPANRGRSSAEMLQIAYQKVLEHGWQLANVDCIVFAERPKLGPVKEQIARRIAEILEISPDAVSVKAKTAEALGPIGRSEAIAAQAIALLTRSRS